MDSKPNKFSTLKEFLTAFKEMFAGFDHITEVTLKKLDIKPKKDGLYHTSQYVELIGKFEKEIWTKSKQPLFEDISDTIKAEFPVLKLDPLEHSGRTMQIEAYNFSILLLTAEFREFSEKVREAFKIPKSGCKDWEERVDCFKKAASELYKKGILKSDDKNEAFMMLRSVTEVWLATHTDFGMKNSKKQDLLWLIIHDYITLNEPFFSVSTMKDSTFGNSSHQIKIPSVDKPEALLHENIELTFCVYYETTKEELKDLLDGAWGQVEYYKNRLSIKPDNERLKDFELLKKKWETYNMRLMRKSYKEISDKLKITESYARKIVSELDKEIEKMKNGKLLPQA